MIAGPMYVVLDDGMAEFLEYFVEMTSSAVHRGVMTRDEVEASMGQVHRAAEQAERDGPEVMKRRCDASDELNRAYTMRILEQERVSDGHHKVKLECGHEVRVFGTLEQAHGYVPCRLCKEEAQ